MKNKHNQDNTSLEGKYYHHQIIDLQVITTSGLYLGAILGRIPVMSNDNYIFQGHTGEALIPAIEDVIKSIDLDKDIITIEAIDDL